MRDLLFSDATALSKRGAEDLLAALGEREQAPATSAAATLLRQQAFTLLVDTYDEVRRAVGYLRWTTNDAETIAPSLWAGRGKRTSGEDAPASTTPGTPGSVPTTSPGAGPATTTAVRDLSSIYLRSAEAPWHQRSAC